MMQKSVFILALTLLLSNLSFAQFKKGKYRSRFKKENFKTGGATVQDDQTKQNQQNTTATPQRSIPSQPGSPVTVKKVPGNNTGNNPNIFGRGTGVKNVQKTAEQKKYVNLNPETAFGPEVITSFDFPNTSLLDLTKHMQKLTGLNLILDKDIKGKISILAPSPITVGDAWKAYLEALSMNGLSLVKSGAFYKIINSRDVRYAPTKIYSGSYSPDTEAYTMRIVPLKNITGTEISRNFRPFMSRYGRIIDIKQTNTIIINDTGSNINRLVRLIKFLDVPGHEESLQIIKVKYSSAQEIAKLLDSILKGTGSSKFKSTSSSSSIRSRSNINRIIAEPRTNSIIAMANADGARKLRVLIKKLDAKVVASGAGKVHVYYLNYGNAEELSKTLNTLVNNSTSSRRTSGRTSRFSSRFSSAASDSGSLFTDTVRLTADKENNALVISASPTDYLTLKSVIEKLDIPRDQVYVEGLIMETSANNGSAFGINLIGAYGSGATQKAGFTGGSAGANDLVNVATNQFSSLGGLFVGGGTGPKVELPGPNGETLNFSTINGLITAVATNGQSNVLATPQILALDNTEAVFEVGETVPVQNATNTANGSTQVSTTDQKISLKLKLKPQINKVTRFIKLEIDQKVDDFSERDLPTTAGGGVGTTTRSAVTTVVVRDRDTIAMGGLMRDKESVRVNKVPLLGDIPVLGWLFKRKEKSKEKVNLLFFLTPKILSTYEKTAASTLKDVLNRRSAHLESTFGDDDPYASTVKGLYNKAKKQAQGPLYDKEDGNYYRKANERNTTQNHFPMPDYSKIVKDINRIKRERAKKGTTKTLNLSEKKVIKDELSLKKSAQQRRPVKEKTAKGRK